jgi:potassium-transporting ATPase potassium-binding subunit
LHGSLPFNPLRFGEARWNLTFNTTSSFITNTNWQYYGGETTMSHLAQMAGWRCRTSSRRRWAWRCSRR